MVERLEAVARLEQVLAVVVVEQEQPRVLAAQQVEAVAQPDEEEAQPVAEASQLAEAREVSAVGAALRTVAEVLALEGAEPPGGEEQVELAEEVEQRPRRQGVSLRPLSLFPAANLRSAGRTVCRRAW